VGNQEFTRSGWAPVRLWAAAGEAAPASTAATRVTTLKVVKRGKVEVVGIDGRPMWFMAARTRVTELAKIGTRSTSAGRVLSAGF
jgi:hypothetical protein